MAYTNTPCPKCGSQVFDNRGDKRNPKGPDEKCSDKSCDYRKWPPKGGAKPAAAPASTKQPFSAGPALPGESPYQETGAPPAAELMAEKLQPMLDAYSICWAHALELSRATIQPSDFRHDAVVAQAATIWIQACQRLVR